MHTSVYLSIPDWLVDGMNRLSALRSICIVFHRSFHRSISDGMVGVVDKLMAWLYIKALFPSTYPSILPYWIADGLDRLFALRLPRAAIHQCIPLPIDVSLTDRLMDGCDSLGDPSEWLPIDSSSIWWPSQHFGRLTSGNRSKTYVFQTKTRQKLRECHKNQNVTLHVGS